MKAIVTTKYGGTEVLACRDIDTPKLEADEILVKVHACSVNPIDWKVRNGAYKFLTGIRPPKILGQDFAGVVIGLGENTSDYKEGDAVWGFVEAFDRGTYAEYVTVKEDEIGLMPSRLSFEEAASIPTVGLTAYQALVHLGHIGSGDRVLINGCSGGVGLAALQTAKSNGCEVTGVTSTRNIDLIRDMGADNVVDYTEQDVLEVQSTYNVFFDVVSNKSFLEAKSTLKTHGIYIRTLPSFLSMVLGPMINLFSSKKVIAFDCKASTKDLNALKSMVETDDFDPLIETIFPLEQVQKAHNRSETGHVVGKLVLKVV